MKIRCMLLNAQLRGATEGGSAKYVSTEKEYRLITEELISE